MLPFLIKPLLGIGKRLLGGGKPDQVDQEHEATAPDGMLNAFLHVGGEVMEGFAIQKAIDLLAPEKNVAIEVPPPPKVPDATSEFNRVSEAAKSFREQTQNTNSISPINVSSGKFNSLPPNNTQYTDGGSVKLDTSGSTVNALNSVISGINQSSKANAENFTQLDKSTSAKLNVINENITGNSSSFQSLATGITSADEVLNQNDTKIMSLIGTLNDQGLEQASYTTNTIADRSDYNTQTILNAQAEMRSAMVGGKDGFGSHIKNALGKMKGIMTKIMLPLFNSSMIQKIHEKAKATARTVGTIVGFLSQAFTGLGVMMSGDMPKKIVELLKALFFKDGEYDPDKGILANLTNKLGSVFIGTEENPGFLRKLWDTWMPELKKRIVNAVSGILYTILPPKFMIKLKSGLGVMVTGISKLLQSAGLVDEDYMERKNINEDMFFDKNNDAEATLRAADAYKDEVSYKVRKSIEDNSEARDVKAFYDEHTARSTLNKEDTMQLMAIELSPYLQVLNFLSGKEACFSSKIGVNYLNIKQRFNNGNIWTKIGVVLKSFTIFGVINHLRPTDTNVPVSVRLLYEYAIAIMYGEGNITEEEAEVLNSQSKAIVSQVLVRIRNDSTPPSPTLKDVYDTFQEKFNNDALNDTYQSYSRIRQNEGHVRRKPHEAAKELFGFTVDPDHFVSDIVTKVNNLIMTVVSEEYLSAGKAEKFNQALDSFNLQHTNDTIKLVNGNDHYSFDASVAAEIGREELNNSISRMVDNLEAGSAARNKLEGILADLSSTDATRRKSAREQLEYYNTKEGMNELRKENLKKSFSSTEYGPRSTKAAYNYKAEDESNVKAMRYLLRMSEAKEAGVTATNPISDTDANDYFTFNQAAFASNSNNYKGLLDCYIGKLFNSGVTNLTKLNNSKYHQDYIFTCPFGYRYTSNCDSLYLHRGVDIRCQSGSYLYASYGKIDGNKSKVIYRGAIKEANGTEYLGGVAVWHKPNRGVDGFIEVFLHTQTDNRPEHAGGEAQLPPESVPGKVITNGTTKLTKSGGGASDNGHGTSKGAHLHYSILVPNTTGNQLIAVDPVGFFVCIESKGRLDYNEVMNSPIEGAIYNEIYKAYKSYKDHNLLNLTNNSTLEDLKYSTSAEAIKASLSSIYNDKTKFPDALDAGMEIGKLNSNFDSSKKQTIMDVLNNRVTELNSKSGKSANEIEELSRVRDVMDALKDEFDFPSPTTTNTNNNATASNSNSTASNTGNRETGGSIVDTGDFLQGVNDSIQSVNKIVSTSNDSFNKKLDSIDKSVINIESNRDKANKKLIESVNKLTDTNKSDIDVDKLLKDVELRAFTGSLRGATVGGTASSITVPSSLPRVPPTYPRYHRGD